MNKTDFKTKALLALQAVEELGYKKKETLLQKVEIDALQDSKNRLIIANILGDKTNEFFEKLSMADKLIAQMKARDISWVTYLDDEYPKQLLEIDGKPFVLYLLGNTSLLQAECIGVVGTRKPTRYGAKIADSFSRDFARAGLCVVSGFARGIDGIAHKACVDCGLPTIAVFACGLDVCYPSEHKGLMDAIYKNNGLIITEYSLGTKPLQYHFPERNRIISGLSRAVFLAEAAIKSGSLITIRLAIEQGKDVYVTPGNIFSEECEGSNNILREMPHALVISSDDVLDAMCVKCDKVQKQTLELNLIENQIIEALKDDELHFEELLELTSLTVSELNNTLINLELNGLIEQTSGNYYVLS